MHTVFKEFTFDAAHWLPNVPKDHQCHRLHGHTYRVKISVTGPLDPVMGWVVDYAEISRLWEDRIHFKLDHRCVNDVLKNSTSEVIASWIWTQLARELPGLSEVEVMETATAGCIYRGGK